MGISSNGVTSFLPSAWLTLTAQSVSGLSFLNSHLFCVCWISFHGSRGRVWRAISFALSLVDRDQDADGSYRQEPEIDDV